MVAVCQQQQTHSQMKVGSFLKPVCFLNEVLTLKTSVSFYLPTILGLLVYFLFHLVSLKLSNSDTICGNTSFGCMLGINTAPSEPCSEIMESGFE